MVLVANNDGRLQLSPTIECAAAAKDLCAGLGILLGKYPSRLNFWLDKIRSH